MNAWERLVAIIERCLHCGAVLPLGHRFYCDRCLSKGMHLP